MSWKNWVKEQGVEKIASDLKVSTQAIYCWLRGEKRPSDIHKKKLIKLAKGEFGYADFFTDVKISRKAS